MPIEERRRRQRLDSKRWRDRHPEYSRLASANYRARNPERVKAAMVADKFARRGVTEARYLELLAAQGGGCAICGTTDPGASRFHIDHDHGCCPTDPSCGRCIRGVLCRGCNMALGIMADNPERLRAAADYIEKHGQTMTAPILPADRKKEGW